MKTDWTNEKEKKVFWKYRFLLTFRVIRVIVALLFLYGIYMMFLSIGYHKTNLDNKHEYLMNLAMDWTQAGNYGDFEPHSTGEITPFFSQKLSFPLYKTIGKEEKLIGNVHVTKRVITSFSTKEIEYVNPADSKAFHFYLPEDPRTGKSLKLSDSDDVWNSLEKVHEGTVANFAFSTTRYFEPKELLQLLAKYDVDVLWMPLYAGELKDIKDVGYSQAGGSYLSVETLGLSKARYTEDYLSYSELLIDKDKIEENEKLMLSNMEMLLQNESKTYVEHLLGLRYLQERHDYLEKNGFKVYGAVITGPVKEILKLKELDVIQGVQLGEFDYWNWVE
ncbi:anti sigma factor C-terminal domain-containing protein [Neobacillus sp. D3-1R]|uniref:anti-sigma factor n=1 Tax=Neobacillus sp. D3-1R TaxID=3445778 RepID=UPI003F9F6CA7